MSKRWLVLLPLLLGVWFGRSTVASAAVTATPNLIVIGPVAVTSSDTATGTLHSDMTVMNASLQLNGAGCSHFSISPNSGIDISAGGDAQITVTFAPTSAGAKNCAVNVRSGGQTLGSFALLGNPPVLSPAPATLPFGNVDVNIASAPQNLTVTNTGGSTLTITSAQFTAGGADYVVSSAPALPVTIAPNGMAVWRIQCKPSAQDDRDGNFRLVSDSQSGTNTDIQATCNGRQGVLQLTPNNHNFNGVVQGQVVTFDFTLRNTGNEAISNLTGVLSDATKGYSLVSTLPGTIGAGVTQPLTLQFAPQSGNDGGAVTLTFSGSWGTAPRTASSVFSIDGNGLGLSFSVPTSVAYGDFRFDNPQTKTLTITNTGEANISVQTVTFVAEGDTATQEIAFPNLASLMLPRTLMPNQSLNVTVQVTPNNRMGSITGHVDVKTDIPGSSATAVPVTGNALAAVLSVSQPIDFGAVDMDAAAPVINAVINNTGNGQLDLTSVNLVTPTGTAGAFQITALGTTSIPAGMSRSIPITYRPTVQRVAGDSDGVVLLVTLSGVGVIGRPMMATIAVKGRGIDRNLVIQPLATLPPTFRNPGDAAPIQTVTVENTGEAQLQISAVMVSGAPVWQLVDDSPVTIEKGTPHDFQVRFSPTMIGAADGMLTLINNDNGQPMATVTLHGEGIGRGVAFGPSQINLGFTGVGVDVTAPDILAITNMDPAVPFKIRSIALSDATTFSVDNSPSSVALPAQSAAHYSITFRPDSIGHFETVAQLYLDDDPVEQAEVRISGDAVFVDAHGSGGCSAGGSGAGSALMLGVVTAFGALGALGRRRRRAGAIASAAAAALVVAAPAARADGVDLAVFAPTPATTGTGFQLQSPEVGPDGAWAFDSTLSYAANPLVLEGFNDQQASAFRNALVETSWMLQLGGAYAFLGRFEAGAQVPLYVQSGQPPPRNSDGSLQGLNVQPADGGALGNISLHLKARLWRSRMISLGAGGLAVLPTASKGQFTGSDQFAARLLLLGSITPPVLDNRLVVSANFGPMMRGKSEYANVVQQSGVAWGVGASVRMLDMLWATGELYGESVPSGVRAQPGSMMPTTLSPSEWLLGARFQPARWLTLGLAFGRGLTDAIGTPSLRGVFSVAIVPGARAIGPIRSGESLTPDADSDGDGILDGVDKCPNEPEDKDGFEDYDGCPDPDNDGDGIPDAVDKCPLDPEDKDGFQDEDGCPDKDNDGDGIPDAIDKCPNEPEDKDGFEDADGCPDLDNDHDGIPDAVDKCPNAPETINGINDDDGCPDKGDTTIVLSPDRIETLDPIQFNGLKLTKASLPLIGQVGATLRAHPEILRVRITVHVQPTNDTAADQTRSDRRAQAVRDWLVQWGIAPTRLEIRGFGGAKPLVSPDQRGAAKLNDRIELIILERK